MSDSIEDQGLISSARLVLRLITRDDALRGLAGVPPAGLRFAAGYPNENGREALQNVMKAPDASFLSFSLVRRQGRDIIGGIGYWFSAGPHRTSVGYDVVEMLQGQGYATEALGALLAYLFSLHEIESVEADTREANLASQRVLEKVGMTHFDTRLLDGDGRPETYLFYEITRSDWCRVTGAI